MFIIFLLNLKIYIHTKEVKYILIDLLLCSVVHNYLNEHSAMKSAQLKMVS